MWSLETSLLKKASAMTEGAVLISGEITDCVIKILGPKTSSVVKAQTRAHV